MNFPTSKKDWKKFELSNKSIALNLLYVPYNTEEIRHAYKSKHSLNCKNQITLLMITDGKKWHYLDVKSLSALFWGITSKHNKDFYCLNFFTHLEQKINLKNKNNLKNLKNSLSNNACADRGLSKIIYIPQKDNLCKWRKHEHQQDQIEKKMSSFKKKPYNFFMNENLLHNCSEKRYLFVYLFI